MVYHDNSIKELDIYLKHGEYTSTKESTYLEMLTIHSANELLIDIFVLAMKEKSFKFYLEVTADKRFIKSGYKLRVAGLSGCCDLVDKTISIPSSWIDNKSADEEYTKLINSFTVNIDNLTKVLNLVSDVVPETLQEIKYNSRVYLSVTMLTMYNSRQLIIDATDNNCKIVTDSKLREEINAKLALAF